MLGVIVRMATAMVVIWAWAPPAYAYLDPGAGSALLQALIGGAALVAAVVAHRWHRLRTWVSGWRARVVDDQQER